MAGFATMLSATAGGLTRAQGLMTSDAVAVQSQVMRVRNWSP